MEKHVSVPLVLFVVIILFIVNYWYNRGLEHEVTPQPADVTNISVPKEDHNGSGH